MKTESEIREALDKGNNMKQKIQIRLKPNGMLEFLSPPPFKVDIKHQARWSEITPVDPFAFLLFRLLRLLFGEHGQVAAWTRSWKLRWRLRVLSTGYTEVSMNRQVLVDKEHELFFQPRGDWLN